MGFVFSYMLEGQGAATPVKDMPLDTSANYIDSVGTNSYTKGDLVYLSSGLIRRTKDVTSAKAVGVLEGTEFVGLVASGQPYAAANVAFNADVTNTTKYPSGMGKVRLGNSAVYRVLLKSGQTAANANIGVSYGIIQDATGDQRVDLTETTNVLVKVIDYTKDLLSVYVVLSTNTSIV